jgi:osmoprotectant transport system permease protein
MDAAGSLMEFLTDFWSYLADPEHWSGPSGIPSRLLEHGWMSLLAVVSASLIAVPLGLWVGHRRKGSLLAVTVVNIGRAVPAFGILALVFIATERLGFIPAYITLVILSLVPLFVNAVTGVEGVDLDVIDAARGMGLSGRQILWRVELPLSLPLVLTGVRLALVDVIATATLAALVAWGGLGRFIIDGFAQRDQGQLVTGALLVAIVAVAADRLVQWAERRTTVGPRGESPAHS